MNNIANRIIDAPSDNDHFSGAGHTRTAKVLAQSFIDLANVDGAVGLEGDWGSGKSTVILLAKKEIENTKLTDINFTFFEFDLWTHQTDNFKRAFLISFSHWLHEKSFISNDDFVELDSKIRSRQSVTTTIGKKVFTKTAALLFLSLFLVPIAMTVFRWQVSLSTGQNHVFLILSIALLFMPIAIVLISLIWNFSKGNKNALSDVLSIFKGQEKEDIKRQFIRDEDPTSSEFKKTINECLELSKKTDPSNQRRFVFILDNIDRLPSNHIPDLWAELRNFFSFEGQFNHSHKQPVTILVPYDKGHILPCLTDQNSSHITSQVNKEDILHKTFTSTFRVSSPVISDSKAYFLDLFETAFSDFVTQETVVQIYQLFNHWTIVDNRLETPRLTKSFINELVTIWNLWEGQTIPILAMALYVLRRNKIEGSLDTLKQGAYVDDFTRRQLFDIDWPKYVAAIHFNVEPELAYQVLLGQDIRKGLFEENSDLLISVESSPGFVSQLLRTVDEVIANLTGRTDLAYHKALHRISELSKIGESDRSNIILAFVNHASSLRAEDTVAETSSQKIGLFYPIKYFGTVRQKTATKYAKTVQTHLFAILADRRDSIADSKSPIKVSKLWAELYSDFLTVAKTHLKAEDYASLVLTKFEIANSNYAIGLAQTKQSTNYSNLADVNVILPTSLAKDIEALMPTNSDGILALCEEYADKFSAINSYAIQDKLAEQINGAELSPSSKSKNIVEAYFKVFTHKKHEAAWELIFQKGAIFRYYKIATEENWYNLQALIRMAITGELKQDVVKAKALPNHPSLGVINADRKVFVDRSGAECDDKEISAYAQLVSKDNCILGLGDLAKLIGAPDGFYSRSFQYAATQGNIKRLNSSKFCKNYEDYRAYIEDIDVPIWLKKIEGWHDYISKACSGTDTLQLSEILYQDIADIKPSKLDILPANLKSHLGGYTSSQWEQSLTSEDMAIKKAILLGELGYDNGVKTTALRPALKSTIEKMLDGSFTPSMDYVSWSAIPIFLADKTRNNLLEDALKYLDSLNTKTNDELINFFKYYRNPHYSFPLAAQPDISIVKILIPMLGRDQENSKWFIDRYSEEFKKCVGSARQETIDQLMENIDSDNAYHLTLIEKFNIKIPPSSKVQIAEDKD